MLEKPIHIVVVDDHERFRMSLMSILNADQRLTVVGQGASAADAIALANTVQPDIIVLDLDMPGSGLDAAAIIHQAHPTIRIVMLTASADEYNIRTAQANGADSYLIKGMTARVLAQTLHSIYVGAQYWPAPSLGSLPARARLA